LKGLNKTHVTAIEELQPYKTGKWIGELVALSNPDKHRDFTPLARSLNIKASTVHGPLGCFDGQFSEDVIHRAYGTPEHSPIDVRVDVDNAHFITFEDGRQVLDLLEEFILKTEEILNAFLTEFK